MEEHNYDLVFRIKDAFLHMQARLNSDPRTFLKYVRIKTEEGGEKNECLWRYNPSIWMHGTFNAALSDYFESISIGEEFPYRRVITEYFNSLRKLGLIDE